MANEAPNEAAQEKEEVAAQSDDAAEDAVSAKEKKSSSKEDAAAAEASADAASDKPAGGGMEGAEEGKKWYVIQAFSGFEKHAAKSLQDHIDRHSMQEFFGRILVPTEEVVEMKGGQKRTSERKFFPGYVLVEMDLTDETWHLVKGVPKITGFIGGTGSSPTPISDKEAREIMQQLEEGADKPRPKFTFAAGEMVRVIDGPFQDFNGSVEDVNFEKSTLRVSVSIFGRSTPVELNFSQVEKS